MYNFSSLIKINLNIFGMHYNKPINRLCAYLLKRYSFFLSLAFIPLLFLFDKKEFSFFSICKWFEGNFPFLIVFAHNFQSSFGCRRSIYSSSVRISASAELVREFLVVSNSGFSKSSRLFVLVFMVS